MAEDCCPRCGWVLGTSAAACPSCGERLARPSGLETNFFPEAQLAGASEVAGGVLGGTMLLRGARTGGESLRLKRQPLLVRKGGSYSGERLPVARPAATVGRMDVEITVDDPALSARHFTIEERGQEFFLRDLDSTNGTFLNGHPVRSARLKSGDEIRAGESVFVFSLLEVIPRD